MSHDSASPGTHSPTVEAEPSRRPTFTITEAAAACAVSRKTITRKLPDLQAAGAEKDDDGIWRIPVEALLALGLHPGRSVAGEAMVDLRRSEDPAASVAFAGPEMITISRERWDDVRIRLARAEAEATERGRALEDARLALRALTAGPAPAAAGELTPPASDELPPPARPMPPGPATANPLAQGASDPGTVVGVAAPSVWDTLFGSGLTAGAPVAASVATMVQAAPDTESGPAAAGMNERIAGPAVMPTMAPVSMPVELPRRRWWEFLR